MPTTLVGATFVSVVTTGARTTMFAVTVPVTFVPVTLNKQGRPRCEGWCDETRSSAEGVKKSAQQKDAGWLCRHEQGFLTK